MIWNTSIVHLTLGFPFCWRLGKGGKASERSHLIHMLHWLPAAALIVADAGYVGYDVVMTMIATQLLLCQGALAMPTPKQDRLPVMCSPRGVLREARRDIAGRSKPSQPFTERLSRVPRDYRLRISPKQKRKWPRRKDHKPPHPPVLLRITRQQKVIIQNT